MAKEKARLQSILDEKDDHISSQKSELDRLNLLISNGGGAGGKKKKRESSPKVDAPPCKAAQGQAHQRPPAVGGSTLDRHRPPGSSAAAVGSGGGVRIHGSSFRWVAFNFINDDKYVIKSLLFRQYKREQKVRSKVTVVASTSSQDAEDPCSPSPSSSSDLGSLGSTSLSSEENRDEIQCVFRKCLKNVRVLQLRQLRILQHDWVQWAQLLF